MQSDRSAVVDGDVIDDLCSGQDAAAKKTLCERLNKDAKKKQSAALEEKLAQAAAEILRTRLVVVHSAAAAKAYMESSGVEGLRARVVLVDFTQISENQAKGAYSKILSKQPNQDNRSTRAFVRVRSTK